MPSAMARSAVFGDYDVDGACAGALMTRFLRDPGSRRDPLMSPTASTEGYGPQRDRRSRRSARGAPR